jgi:hypothetical protein
MNNLSFINNLPNDILCKIYKDTIEIKNRHDFEYNIYKYLKKEVVEQLNEIFYEFKQNPDDYDTIYECIYETDNESCYRLEDGGMWKGIYLTCIENKHIYSSCEEYNDIHTFIKNKLDNPLFLKKSYQLEYFDKLWKYTNKIKNIKKNKP